jgi:hypothetical protein
MGACCFKPSVSEDVVESSAANSGTGDRGRRANRRGDGATRGVTSDGQLTILIISLSLLPKSLVSSIRMCGFDLFQTVKSITFLILQGLSLIFVCAMFVCV